jgi:hypothetical protein
MTDLLNKTPSSAPKDIQARSISDKSDKKDVQEHNNVSRSISAEPLHDDVPTKETETLLSDAQPPIKMYTKDEADALIAAAVATAVAKMAGTKDINALLNESRLVANEKKPVTMMDAHIQEDEKTHVRERDASILSKTSTAGFDDDDAELATGTAIVYSEEPSMEYRSFRKLSTGPSTTYDQDPLVEALLPPLPRPELTQGTAAVFSQEPVDDIPARPSSPPPPALLSKATFSDITPNKGKSPMSELASEEDLVQQRSLASPSYEKGTITSMSTTSTHSMYDPETGASNANMIGLITQTMIGDWLYKYTRKTVGNGISENRHQRYFWIHPYTRTLYWSTNAPGLNDHGGKAKSGKIRIGR